jgi:hypothetical protein
LSSRAQRGTLVSAGVSHHAGACKNLGPLLRSG